MQEVTITVPGKIMLAGEYAVLRSGAAMACTVSSQMRVSAKRQASGGFSVSSDLWPKTLRLDSVIPGSEEWQEPAVQVLQYLKDQHPTEHVHLNIASQIKVAYGAGSSAALRLGCLLAAKTVLSEQQLNQTDRWDCGRVAFELQRKAQDEASGYDIATQCMGGLTIMRPHGGAEQWPGLIAHISGASTTLNQFVLPLASTAGSPTKPLMLETIAWLNEYRQWENLDSISERCIDAFTQALTARTLEERHYQDLISAVISHRDFFGDSPAGKNSLLPRLRDIKGYDQTWTCKTTGAGGEDAVLLIGPSEEITKVAAQVEPFGWVKAPLNFVETAAGENLAHE